MTFSERQRRLVKALLRNRKATMEKILNDRPTTGQNRRAKRPRR